MIKSIHPAQSSKTALMKACEAKISFLIDTLLAQNVDVDEHNFMEQTALYYACHARDLVSMRKLLESGADVDNIDKSLQTVLILCTCLGFYSGVELLLEYKPQIKFRDREGCCALLWAVKKQDVAIAQLLLRYSKRYLDKFDDNACNALVYACAKPQMLEVLLQYHPRINIKNNSSKNIFHHMAQNNYIESYRIILKYCQNHHITPEVNMVDFRNRTPLAYCAEEKKYALYHLMVATGSKLHLTYADKSSFCFVLLHDDFFDCLLSYSSIEDVEKYLAFIKREVLDDAIDIGAVTQRIEKCKLKLQLYAQLDNKDDISKTKI